MNWNLAAAYRALTGKESLAGPLISLGEAHQPRWTPRRYDELAKEAYQKNVVAYVAISMVAQGFASVPWRLFRRRAGKRTEVVEHRLLDLLARPNPVTGSGPFLEALASFVLIAGNSYVEVAGPEGKPPRELWNLRPDRMRVVPGDLGVPEAYQYTLKGQGKRWPVDPLTGKTRIMHWRAFHPLDDWYGMSAIEAAAFSVDQHNQAGEWNQTMLANRAQPSGVLIYKPTDAKGRGAMLTDPQRAQLQADLDSKMSGASNNNRPLLLEGDFKWEQMGLSARDMDWLKGRDVSARDVAIAFGVAPQLVGIPDTSTYANMMTARLSLWEETIIPLLGRGRDELNNWLTPMFDPGLSLDFDLDEVPALVMRRKEKFETYRRTDFLTINEKREAVGFPPVDGGDVLLVSATMLPLNFASSPVEGASALGPEAYKLLTDRSPGARQRELAVQTRLRVALERSLMRTMAAEIERASRATARAFARGGLAEAMHEMLEHEANVDRALRASYAATMEVFGARILDAAKADDGAGETKDADDAFRDAANLWVQQHAAAKVSAIAETMRDQIRSAVAEGEAGAESVTAIAKRIREATGGLIGRHRSVLISRTETHSAAVAAGDQAAEATGLELRREWIAAADERTRDTHVEADGQVVGLKEPFQVGSSMLIRPGDPAGDPAETINCRCVVGHLTMDEVA